MRDCSKLTSQLNGLVDSTKIVSFWVNFNSWEQKKVTQRQVRTVGWVRNGGDVFLYQEHTHSQWCVTWHIVMVTMWGTLTKLLCWKFVMIQWISFWYSYLICDLYDILRSVPEQPWYFIYSVLNIEDYPECYSFSMASFHPIRHAIWKICSG